MRQVSIDYSNTQNLINNLRSILRNLDNEKREVNSALRELYDLENYYYNKGEIVQELEYRQRKISKDIESTEELIDNISRFLNEVKETDGNLANKFKQDIKAYAKKNNIDLVSDFENFLNKFQSGLDILGFIPVIGDIADGINVFISLARGDIKGAFINALSILPFGDAAKAFKYMGKTSDVLKFGSKSVDMGKATLKLAMKKAGKSAKKEVLGIIAKGEKEFKNVLEATLDLGKNDYISWIKDKGKVLLNTVNDKLPDSIALCLDSGCLIGETLVKTLEGFKPIRELEISDLVLSKNEKLGIDEYKKVTEIHRNSTYESCILSTKNSIIEATTGHLFMIKGKWWTAAIDIKENDYIELSNGNYEEILKIEYKENNYPIKVYNLTVEDNHNYYVGEKEVLTHNMTTKKRCKLTKKTSVSKPKTRLPRTNGKWSGEPGNGKWFSNNPKVINITGSKGVEFRNGRPNFSPWSKGDLNFKQGQLNGTHTDFSLVYEKIQQQYKLPSKNAAKKLLKDIGLTPHHKSPTKIELIPSDLHGNIPHIGSAADMRGVF
ncbi:hypothetical protein LI064_14355 [Clostridium perfringens]|uniref:polymorphic toxin-type HINT domain-containing protein n=1 Tax=Clostridium perfringens TaxID=1502 RepID=UPI002247FF71|nr:polymorphic toxin-type HINT domain-containing protein [Clostridium perfringens]MCX0355699.1 hypothetical protein [Clostridium perfringens]MDM0612526.1 polymorphic toxin-type HINT domain-containing protein [Clostridium perfringens]